MNVKLHIERLVLEGISLEGKDAELLRTSATTELSRLLTQGGLDTSLSAGGAFPQLRVRPIQLDGGGPSQIGKELARTLYREMGTSKTR